ncbi:MAG: hypothetical protein ACRC80_10805 [Waterburya sp.]
MCLVTIFWQQSYLLIINNWINLAITIYTIACEELEYYGIYDPSIISVAVSIIFFKLIEYGGEIIFKFIFSKVKKEIFIS